VFNLLDLHLEHLDIDIRDANHAEVDAIVRTCGQSMSRVTFGAPCLLTSYRTQLDLSARSTREEAAALVSAAQTCRWSADLSSCTRISADMM
jgi:hypothetical protein